MDELIRQLREMDDRIEALRAKERRIELDMAYGRAASSVLLSLAQMQSQTALIHPDPKVAGEAFAKSYAYSMAAGLAATGALSLDRIQTFLESTR
jgi:prefoldin subunit 5